MPEYIKILIFTSFTIKCYNCHYTYKRFAAIREIFEMFNTNCGKTMEPPKFLALDETLYPMRNKCSMKQYNPNKV